MCIRDSFHTVLETAEVYHCLKGEGYMVMETPEGEWAVAELRPGVVLYVCLLYTSPPTCAPATAIWPRSTATTWTRCAG